MLDLIPCHYISILCELMPITFLLYFCDLSIIILEPFVGVRSRRAVEHVGEMSLFLYPAC